MEAVHGLDEVGKSELVTDVAHRYSSDYDLIWWIDGTGRVPPQRPSRAWVAD